MKRRPQLPLPLVDALMREHTGLTVGHLREDERLSVLTAAMRKAGFSDDATYAMFLRTYPASLLDLASQLSVGETYFFRDPNQLRLLTDDVLPRLLIERPSDHVFTFWSAGCASGEEPYTIAMLLDERGLLDRSRIVGTDISEVALGRARAGRFSSWSLRATSSMRAQRYFREFGREFELLPALRERVSFTRQNLTDARIPLPGDFTSAFDVILCRNVLIYFTDQACRQASLRLTHALAAGGTLFTSPSDPFIGGPELRRETSSAGVLFTRTDKPVLRASAPQPLKAPALPADWPALPVAPSPVERAQPGRARTEPQPGLARAETRAEKTSAEKALESELSRVREVGKREGNERAIEACRRALDKTPDAIDLHLWLSALLLELGRDEEAQVSLRTLLYLDRELVMGHLLSALLARRRGDHPRAARAYQRVVRLCEAHDEQEPVPMGDGVDHGTLAESAAAELRAMSKLGRAS